MESVEMSGKSVEDAVQQALARLGRRRDEVDVTVVNEGHRGILGFVRGESARVRVTVREPGEGGAPSGTTARQSARPSSTRATARSSTPRVATSRPSPRPRPAPRPEAAPGAAPGAAPSDGTTEPPAPVKLEGPAIVARDVLEEMLEKMAIDAEVIARGGNGTEESPILLDVAGEDLGVLIGRRGETLSSLQFLLNIIVGKRLDSWVRILVDIESYRARREEALRSLAARVADRVRRNGQSVLLEPMPPNERRIVHMALQDDPDVTTESSGYGEDRRVTVFPRAAGDKG